MPELDDHALKLGDFQCAILIHIVDVEEGAQLRHPRVVKACLMLRRIHVAETTEGRVNIHTS